MSRVNEVRSHFLTFILVAMIFQSLVATNTAAAKPGDLAINAVINPAPGGTYTTFDIVSIVIEIENNENDMSPERKINWAVCTGEKTYQACFGDSLFDGIKILAGMNANQIQQVEIGSFTDWNQNRSYTLAVGFDDYDQNVSNDKITSQFTLTNAYVDLSVGVSNPFSDIPFLTTLENKYVINSNTDYVLEFPYTLESCGTCIFDATFGWKLYSSNGQYIITESNNTQTLASTSGIEKAFTEVLPTFNHHSQGTFLLEFGLYNSSDDVDVIPSNNLHTITIEINDKLDIKALTMFPTQDPTAESYYFGENGVTLEIENSGYVSVYDISASLTIKTRGGTQLTIETCIISDLHPTEIEECRFDINNQGDLTFEANVQQIINGTVDESSSNNKIIEDTTVIAGLINPVIIQSNPEGLYYTGDNITLSVEVSPFAASPLSYTWKHSSVFDMTADGGFIINGSDISFLGSALGGMGLYRIAVYVTDAAGYDMSTSIEISLINSTDISHEPYFSGTAITRSHAYSISSFDYPIINGKYNPGQNLSALRLLSFELFTTEKTGGEWVTTNNDLGLEFYEITFNLTNMFPTNIPFDSIDIHQLNDINGTAWTDLSGEDAPERINNYTLKVTLKHPIHLLFVGELPTPEINISEIDFTQLANGGLKLNWTISGDIDNPYIGNLFIHKLTGGETGLNFFTPVEENYNQFAWDALLSDSRVSVLTFEDKEWTDPEDLQTGLCASYILIPSDRAGNPLLEISRVSLNNEGVPGMQCGDAIEPVLSIQVFTASVGFENSTDCLNRSIDWYACYYVNLNWTFPEETSETNFSWNLYRLNQKPAELDLRFLSPILTGIENKPGESQSFVDNGSSFNGVRPYQVYYYVLTATDNIGNENTIASYPSENVVRAEIEDIHWEHNEWRVPEPPPPEDPPLNSQWVGSVYDGIENPAFQTAGFVLLGIIVLNFIGLPLLIQQRRKLKRKIGKNKQNQGAEELADDLMEFFS